MAAPLQLDEAALAEQGKHNEQPPSFDSFPQAPLINIPHHHPSPFPPHTTPYTVPPPQPQPSFFISGASSEQLNIYLHPHQTLFTHNDYVGYLSPKLTVEQMPTIELPASFHTNATAMDSVFQCILSFTASLCRCSFVGERMLSQNSNFHRTRLVVNNNDISGRDAVPYICLSPSLPMSSPHSFGRRKHVAPCYDSSRSISSPLTRKILR